jgi:hypothetical protein
MNIEELIQIIEMAFDGVPQPQDITLHVAEAHDNYDYDLDIKHRQSDFIGRWQDVPTEHIEKCQAALSYVDKIGMRFYLPAFMVWILKNFGSPRISAEHTLYTLDDHSNSKDLVEYHKEQFSLFTSAQLRACALFVKFCANDTTDFTDSYFAEKSYQRYWARYDKI